jgi:eukaryotic-like serine/threonine-protein kinase
MIREALSPYRVLEEIGAGGMGEVYRAHDEPLNHDVAVKVLTPGTLKDENSREASASLPRLILARRTTDVGS